MVHLSVFVEFLPNSTKYLVGVVYLPKGNVQAFEELHSDLLLQYPNIIIMDDFNYNLFHFHTSLNLRSTFNRLNLTIMYTYLFSPWYVVCGANVCIILNIK